MHVQPDLMAQAVNEVLPERFAMLVFTVGIDVVVGNFEDALVALAAQVHAGLQRSQRRVLRAQHDLVDFALPRREFAVGGKRARDVRGIAGVLRANIQHHDVAVLNLARKLVVVQRRGIRARADDRRVALRFRAAHGVNLHHFGGDLIFVKTGPHHLHRFKMRVERKVDGLFQKRQFPRVI